MIAAAVAAMAGGAFAEVNVYDITVKGDTINKVKSMSVRDPATGERQTCYYAEKGSLSLKGLYAVCWCEETVKINKDGTEAEGFLAVWNAGEKKSYIIDADVPTQKYLLDYLISGVRFGKKSEKVGVMTTLDLAKDEVFCGGAKTNNWGATLVLAGFGTGTIAYDADYDVNVLASIKSASGNAVGVVRNSLARANSTDNCAACEDNTCDLEYVAVIELCDDFDDWCIEGDQDQEVPFSGTWKMKYNSKASSACTKGSKYILDYVPAYCK